MRSRFNTNNGETDLDNVVSAEVKGGEGGGVAEGGARQTPDVVICEVEDLELAQAPEGLLPQLQGHGPGPLAVVSLHPELPEVLEADKGAVRKHFQFTELHTELRQLGQGPKLVRVHDRLVEVDI